jgi:hypothetical protein
VLQTLFLHIMAAFHYVSDDLYRAQILRWKMDRYRRDYTQLAAYVKMSEANVICNLLLKC